MVMTELMTRNTGKCVGEEIYPYLKMGKIITQCLFTEYLLGSMEVNLGFDLRKVGRKLDLHTQTYVCPEIMRDYK